MERMVDYQGVTCILKKEMILQLVRKLPGSK